MWRRDRDLPPAIEPWEERAEHSTVERRVEVGSTRTRRALLVVAATVVTVAGGVALRSALDDDATSARPPERTSTTGAPRTTTASTSTTVVLGPVFPVRTGGALLVSDRTAAWTWLDLDTGLRREVQVDADDPSSVVAARGGVVALRSGRATFVPLPEGEPVALGRAEMILGSGRDDRVWLVRVGQAGTEGVTATLVDLAGEPLTPEIEVPTGALDGATDRELVFSRGGRSYLADAGGIRPISEGMALRAAGHVVVVQVCDERARCAPEVIDLAGGPTRRLAPFAGAGDYSSGVILAGDGRVALLAYDGSRQSLRLVDEVGLELGTMEELSLLQSEPAFLPGDLGLVAVLPTGIVRIHADGGDGLVVDPIEALADRFGSFVYVIAP